MFVLGFVLPARAADRTPSPRFERLRAQESRLAGVAYRLAVSSGGACRESATPQSGIVLHDIAHYGPADREAAAYSYGLDGDASILAVVAGSPADRAGLEADDRLVSINGRAPRVADATSETARILAERSLETELRKGPVTLRVARRGVEREVRFAAEFGCPSNVALVPGNDVNAFADGARVTVTDAILAQCDSDADLALIVAHELAHNLLHHRQRLAGVSGNGMLPVSAAGSARIRATEEEADRFAVGMMRAAGYDLGEAPAFLQRLLEANGLAVRAAASHPAMARRLALLRAAIAGGGYSAGIANTARSGFDSGRM